MLIEILGDKTFNVFLLILEEWLLSIDFKTVFEHFVTLYDIFLDILSYVIYFFPMPYLVPLILFVFVILTIRIVISLLRLIVNILDGIPLIG